MAARTRTIQRTPNVGLTLKMQPVAEAPEPGCTPAPEAIRWYNEDDDAWDLDVIERRTDGHGTSRWPYRVVTAEGCEFCFCDPEREMYLARVIGPICDNDTQWTWALAESDSQYWHIQPAGSALGVNITVPSYGVPAGVLTVTATVAGATLGPIYFVLSDPVWCC